MVDVERIRRLLQRISDDLLALDGYVGLPREDVRDFPANLGHVKYLFVTAIEGCVNVAHHLGASEGWAPPETNAHAMKIASLHGVFGDDLAESMVEAVRFRNLLVHRYAEVDDNLVVAHLDRVGVLHRFVAAIVDFVDTEPTGSA